MAKETCTVCGREIDSRGMSGHMKTHVAKQDDGHESGVISYPSNEQETDVKQDVNTETPDNVKQPKKKKVAKKTVVSKPASKPASNSGSKSTGHSPKVSVPDTREQHNSGATYTEGDRSTSSARTKRAGHPKDSGAHKKEWQGFFRE